MSVRIPMKFAEVEIDHIEDFLVDDAWVMEQKLDGTRGLVVLRPGIEPWWPGSGGRKSLAHTAATQWFGQLNPMLQELVVGTQNHVTEIVLDGEIMTETGEYHAFDLPYWQMDGQVLVEPSMGLAERRAWLSTLSVPQVAQAVGYEAKKGLLERVQSTGCEGVMLKREDGPYESGARVKHSVKAKITKTADVVVTRVERPDPKHGSFTFAVFDHDNVLTEVGRCSAIGKPEVAVGDVIEVKYLYLGAGGALVQPRMMRLREDKAPGNCRMDQFPVYSREVV